MATSYLPYDPQQMLLLPEAIQDWLPEGHLAHLISDTVDTLDLGAFHARYEQDGPRNQPFHPAMMVKVLLYGYATGVFSSRKIARKLHEDVAFRVLGAGNFPAHRTIRDFRANHLQELSELFVQVVRLAGEMGLVKLGTVAIGGTKIKANASRHKAMSCGHMMKAEAELKGQIQGLLKCAAQADEAARVRLEQRQREQDRQQGRRVDDEGNTRGPGGGLCTRPFGVPEAQAQENFTDPDSRIMKRAGGGFDPAYNAQTAVDAAAHIIVVAELDNAAPDAKWLLPMIQAVRENLGELPELGLADAGYRSEENLRLAPIELVVALGREGKRHAQIDPQTHPYTAAMAAKLHSPAGRAAYRKRKWIAEPPNEWLKSVLGFRQFSLRGMAKARAEFKLVCAALNLRRMATMVA